MRWRLVVHALDRTGPPMLARSLLRWLRREHPDDEVDVVAMWGGELVDDFAALAPLRTLLDAQQAWHPATADEGERRILRDRAAGLAPADCTLLVSVAAGQAIDFLPEAGGPILTWVVEQGDDLHWLASLPVLSARTDRWLAGSVGTRAAIADAVGAGEVVVVPEFIDEPQVHALATVANIRSAIGAGPDQPLIIGAGIATLRKAPDLFVEVALWCERARQRFLFAWIGGHQDQMFAQVVDMRDHLGLQSMRFFESVADLGPWLDAADVFLHPARLDAFPLVCIQAAANGTPVVAFSGAGGVPEMLGDTFVGAPYPDVAGLGGAVARMAHAPEGRFWGSRQASHVRARYLAPVAAPAVYAQLLAAARGAG